MSLVCIDNEVQGLQLPESALQLGSGTQPLEACRPIQIQDESNVHPSQ